MGVFLRVCGVSKHILVKKPANSKTTDWGGEGGDGARVLWEYRGVLVMIDCHRWISLSSIYLYRHPPPPPTSLLRIEEKGKLRGGGKVVEIVGLHHSSNLMNLLGRVYTTN